MPSWINTRQLPYCSCRGSIDCRLLTITILLAGRYLKRTENIYQKKASQSVFENQASKNGQWLCLSSVQVFHSRRCASPQPQHHSEASVLFNCLEIDGCAESQFQCKQCYYKCEAFFILLGIFVWPMQSNDVLPLFNMPLHMPEVMDRSLNIPYCFGIRCFRFYMYSKSLLQYFEWIVTEASFRCATLARCKALFGRGHWAEQMLLLLSREMPQQHWTASLTKKEIKKMLFQCTTTHDSNLQQQFFKLPCFPAFAQYPYLSYCLVKHGMKNFCVYVPTAR